MDLVEELAGASRIALDTPTLIYFFQDESPRVKQIAPIFELLDEGKLRGVISALTLAELLVGPLQHGYRELAREYSERLRASGSIDIVPADAEVAERAAEIRADHGLHLPDAMIVATALVAGCSHIVTNDASMSRVDQPTVLLIDSYTE